MPKKKTAATKAAIAKKPQPKKFSVRDTFGVDVPKDIMALGYDTPSQYVPKVNPLYVFRADILMKFLMWFLKPEGDAFYLYGPTGSGKTTFVEQVFARLNIPLFGDTCHERYEVVELFGHRSLKEDGSMEYVYGQLVLAATLGFPILFNEMDTIPPGVDTAINEVVTGKPFVLTEAGGKLITPKPGFRFIATGNTNMAGDTTGLYIGTLRKNTALQDRFRAIELGYPDRKVEEDILKKVAPALPDRERKVMIDVVTEVRQQFIGLPGNESVANPIEVPFSTRALIRWARVACVNNELVEVFENLGGSSKKTINALGAQNILLESLESSLLWRATSETKVAVRGILQRITGA